MSNELTLQEAALAWAQGKRVEAIHKTLFSERWTKVEPAGAECSNTYSAGVFGDCAGKYRFRLAPEPPAKKFQPFTKGTIPKFALWKYPLNRDEAEDFYCITGYGDFCVLLDDDWISYQDLLTNGRMSKDNGKTWLPCGVEVEA